MRPSLLMSCIDRPIARISSSLVLYRVPRSGSFTLAKSTPEVQWLSYSPLDPRFAGSIPAGIDRFFSERKNPEYDFLRKGSKAVGPVS